MPDREKVISTFEKIISVCKEDRCDFVDLTFEDAEQILALLKEQNDAIEKAYSMLKIAEDKIKELLKEQERKKGSWDYGTQCSVCKGTIVPPWKGDTRVNFCPWCGADMRDSYESKDR